MSASNGHLNCFGSSGLLPQSRELIAITDTVFCLPVRPHNGGCAPDLHQLSPDRGSVSSAQVMLRQSSVFIGRKLKNYPLLIEASDSFDHHRA